MFDIVRVLCFSIDLMKAFGDDCIDFAAFDYFVSTVGDLDSYSATIVDFDADFTADCFVVACYFVHPITKEEIICYWENEQEMIN